VVICRQIYIYIQIRVYSFNTLLGSDWWSLPLTLTLSLTLPDLNLTIFRSIPCLVSGCRSQPIIIHNFNSNHHCKGFLIEMGRTCVYDILWPNVFRQTVRSIQNSGLMWVSRVLRPLDTEQVISETSLYRQSLALALTTRNKQQKIHCLFWRGCSQGSNNNKKNKASSDLHYTQYHGLLKIVTG